MGLISAKHKKWVLWAGDIYFLAEPLLLVIPDSAGPRNRALQEKVIASVLTDGDTNEQNRPAYRREFAHSTRPLKRARSTD